MLTFRMRIGVRFNREIDPKEHNISIGGYEMIMGGGRFLLILKIILGVCANLIAVWLIGR